MFGVSRKKSKPTRVRSTASSSDDDDEDGDAHRSSSRAQQHHKKKKSRKSDKKKSKAKSPMLSFDPEEGGDDDEDDDVALSRKKSKKRKKQSSKQRKKNGDGGLGYGGIGAMPMNTSDGSSEEEDKVVMGGADEDRGSYYDMAALEKLKKEQKRSTLVKDDTIQSESAKPSVAKESGAGGAAMEEGGEAIEEEFIPLSGGKPAQQSSSHDPVVLTGDDAMAYAQRDEDENDAEFDHGLQSPPTPPSGGITNEKEMAGKVAGMDINADIMMDVDEPTEEVEEGNQKWEDTMARRAGVIPPSAAASNQKEGRSSRQRINVGSSSSLSQIRISLQPTINNLQNISSDLETSISRHQSTITSSKDDLTKQQSTLEKHGKALEYYQGLREDLATWMGALRELNGMVEKVEESKGQLEAEMTWRRMERFWEWGEDCAEVLEKEGLLKNKVVGENGPVVRASEQAISQVDEFGRDLSSMASMSRIKRWNQRRKRSVRRLQEEHDNGDALDPFQEMIGCSNEDNFDSSEIGEWNRRHDALVRAIAIIPNLVKDDYLSISNLCSLFSDWENIYPEDYANCYANMSLVQMIEVLVRLELAERWDPLDLHAHSSGTSCANIPEFKWFHEVKKRDYQKKGNGETNTTPDKSKPQKDILVEVINKQVVGRLLESFSYEEEDKCNNKQHGIYNPFSDVQTRQQCLTVKSLLEYLSNLEGNGKSVSEKTTEKIFNALLSCLKCCIEKMSVPIVDSSKILLERNEFLPKNSSRGFEGEICDAIAYATIIQAKELCTLVKNILGHWYPIITQNMTNQGLVKSFVQFVFVDLVSIRLLPNLHSLHDITSGSNGSDKKYPSIAKMIIDDILDAMQGAALLDTDEWMLMAAPLRVAAKQLM